MCINYQIAKNFRYREKLRVHALRVMAVVEKTIHRLNEETKAAMVIKVRQIEGISEKNNFRFWLIMGTDTKVME